MTLAIQELSVRLNVNTPHDFLNESRNGALPVDRL